MPPSPDTAAPFEPPFDPSAFDLLDVAVAWADDSGLLRGANAAFEAATARPLATCIGQPMALALGLAEAELAAALAKLPGDGGVLPRQVLNDGTGRAAIGRLGLRRQGRWWVFSWQPLRDEGELAETVDQLSDKLETVQRLALFGFWTPDVQTLAGDWDHHVWRLWGLDPPKPGAVAPDFGGATQAIHPADRDALAEHFKRSLAQVGSHSHRYRLQAAGGQLRHLRSLWQVRPDEQGKPERLLGLVLDDTETYELARGFEEASVPLRQALALADVAVWQYRRGEDRVHTNDQGWALLGQTPRSEGMLLAELLALVHPDDLPQHPPGSAPEALGAAAASERLLRIRHCDGSWRHVLTRRMARWGADGQLSGYLGVALDLSERLAQQQHALDLSRSLALATEAAGLGIWSVTLAEPIVVQWDPQMRELHGLTPGQRSPALRAYLAQHVLADDRAMVAEKLDQLLRRGKGQIDVDLRITRPDGQVRRLATRSSVVSRDGVSTLYGVMLDVTERHGSEQRLREADERAALVARGAGIGTWESHADAGLGWWDEQMFKLRGQPPRDTPVRMDEALTWVHPDDRAALTLDLAQAVVRGQPALREFRVVWPDGSVRWLASRSTPLRDAQGQRTRWIGINWDTTALHQEAQAREERLAAQRESQAKSGLLARISHELRTPLNAVLGFSQLLLAQRGSPDPAQWRRQVGHVQAAGQHLLALVDDVLELSSLESGELSLTLEPVDVAALARSSLPLVEALALEHGVSLRLQAEPGWAMADPVRLRQVLVNLLSNGIKYNRPGGQVSVSVVTEAGRLRLAVQDTGCGLDAEQQRQLFEAFNRLGREHGAIAGTGIGLAIARAAVQQMAGVLAVHSEPGVGSCFEVQLQALAVPALAITPAALPVLPAGAPLPRLDGWPRLLYIEDNPVNLMLVGELVRYRGDISFFSAIDGASGLRAAVLHQPALILIDMQLPDFDGDEVLRRLRADPATASIPCIALSANAMPEDIERARAMGFDDYWTKPLDLEQFSNALTALFGLTARG